MSRTTRSYSLSEEALARLAELAEAEERSASRVVERLIMAAGKQPAGLEAVRETFEQTPPSAEARVEKQIKAVGTILAGPKKPVQDISSTKKIIERPAKAGRPEQGKTTLTGRKFGPVPK